MNEEQKKEAIKKLFDAVVKPTDSDSWLDEARAYHDEVRAFAKNASTLTDFEKEKFFEKFLYKKNGTAGLGQSASFSKDKRPRNAAEIFEASCITVGLFDTDSGVKRCEHGAQSAECLQRAA